MSNYVAVVRRSGGDDELSHFKYIKREKRNGKWVYTYDTDTLSKYNTGKTETKKTEVTGGRGAVSKYKTNLKKITTTTEYKKSNKLFDSTKKSSVETSASKVTHVVKSQGKLSRAVAKGEKILYDKVLKKVSGKISTGDEIKKKAAKGEEKVMKTLGLDKRAALKKQEKMNASSVSKRIKLLLELLWPAKTLIKIRLK